MKMKKIIIFTTIIAVLIGVILLQHHKLNERNTEYVIDTLTITLTDTINLEKPILVKKEVVRYDTLTLTDTTTLTDTLTLPVPISEYVLDTLIITDSSETHLKAFLEGFSVSMDSLSITTIKTHQETCLTPKTRSFHWGYGIALGFGWVK
jgi:hypothetical protein